MTRFVRHRILLLALALCTASVQSQAAPADAQSNAFNIRLPSVKLGYPGSEYWAQIESPDGQRTEAFAIFRGGTDWTVPIRARTAGRYRLMRVEQRQGDKVTEVAFTNSSGLTLNIASPNPPTAARQQGMVDAGTFTPFFTPEEPWCVNDHTLVQGPDKAWHLFGITHPKPLDFFKDPGRRLAHARAGSLQQRPWQALPPAVTADWDRYHEYLLWAPHVVRHEGTYYMFVCAGEKDSHNYRLHLITSSDLKDWARHPANPILRDGFDGRDPMVLRLKDQWVLYYTATSMPEGGNHIVAAVTSTDLVHWANRKMVFVHPRAGTFGGPTESPFVVQRGDRFYLFLCDNDWTDVYLSSDPFKWEFEGKVSRIRAHAAEIVRDTDGAWHITHTGWMNGPVCLAPLNWHDGLDGAPTSIPPAQ